MAIIEELGIEVTMEVNGVKAAEYTHPPSPADATASNPTQSHIVERYIESIDDAEFAVCIDDAIKDPWIRKGQERLHIFEVYVDGKHITGVVTCPGQKSAQRRIDGVEEFGETSVMAQLRRFKFSAVTPIEQVNEKRVQEDRTNIAQLALIEIRVLQRTQSGEIYRRESQSIPTTSSLNLASKALIGAPITHGTSYTDGPPVKIRMTIPIKGDSLPIATFRFRYGSKTALKDHLIIPRTPVQTPEPPSFDALSNEERDRLARERFNELQKIKQEETDEVTAKRKIIDDAMGGSDGRPAKLCKTADGNDCYDLTDD